MFFSSYESVTDHYSMREFLLRIIGFTTTGSVVCIYILLNSTPALAEGNVQPAAIHATKEATSKSEASVISGSVEESESGVQGATWIAQQPSTNYTVQLMVAATPQQLTSFVRRESFAAPLAIAGFHRNSQPLYLLVQGSYATRVEADTVAAQLEAKGAVRPWVRSFSALPELIESGSATAAAKPQPARAPLPSVAGAAWLWSRNPLRYTVQLMNENRIEKLRDFVSRRRPDGPLAIVRVKRDGRWRYLLLAGDYATAAEAEQAIKGFSSTLTVDPVPRRFATLQEMMVAANH